MIVHALLAGRTLCQTECVCDKLPCDWPEDHRWTYTEDLENITCEECKEVADKMPQGEA